MRLVGVGGNTRWQHSFVYPRLFFYKAEECVDAMFGCHVYDILGEMRLVVRCRQSQHRQVQFLRA